MVSGRIDVVRDGIGQPRAIVRNAGSHTLARMRQPPMLDIALDELARGGAQQMLAREQGLSRGERHAVLQLIAEAVGAAGLIKSGARPDSATQRLVQQPTVEHDVHRPVGGLDDDRTENFLPSAPDVRFDSGKIGGAIARDEVACCLNACRLPQQENDFDRLSGRQFDLGAQCRTGIEPRTNRLGQRCVARERGRVGERAVAADEFAPIARPARLGRRTNRQRRRATRSSHSSGLRANIAPVAASISVEMNGRDAERAGPRTHST